jgi:hypothetical protein
MGKAEVGTAQFYGVVVLSRAAIEQYCTRMACTLSLTTRSFAQSALLLRWRIRPHVLDMEREIRCMITNYESPMLSQQKQDWTQTSKKGLPRQAVTAYTSVVIVARQTPESEHCGKCIRSRSVFAIARASILVKNLVFVSYGWMN